MNRRLTVLAGALAVALTAPQVASPPTATAAGTAAAATTQPGGGPDRSADAQKGLNRLKADAAGTLRVHRATDGAVDFVSSSNGRAMVAARGTNSPSRTVTDQLARYGQAFGIDGAKSRAVVRQTTRSSTGGSVVRADQIVDGVPVFGGQVVMSLDKDQGVVSVDAATTATTEVAQAVVSEANAERAALAVTARSHKVAEVTLTAVAVGRRLFDPAIVHTFDPLGARPVWQFSVTNGSDIRETVLIGTGRGEVALHFNDAPGIDRVVCDNAEARTVDSSSEVPLCTSPARTETGAASGVADVDAAFANLGAVSDAYASLDGIDLTALIGAGTPKKLMSTVNWCYSGTDTSCPFANAFWDGTQMVFGQGYAGADDVVGHELTHGYVERTAALFSFHQSGALNESLADTIGEIVDHRNPASPADDSAWTIGEDLPGAAGERSLQDPTLHNQPDRMKSPLYVTADVTYDAGAVHDNDGVGNKTAYLISQGGTFNGQTITGIDGLDTGLAKTGRLYLETIPRLTSGSEYADLGRVLASTCDQLAAASTGGFVPADCAAVRQATTATELAQQPTDPNAAAAEAPISCPTGNSLNTLLKRDDDGINGFGLTTSSGLWGRAPGGFVPGYAVSGTESLFGLDPDPSLGDPSSGSATSAAFKVPTSTGGTFLNFHHAYVMDWYASTYYDGGQVVVEKLVNGVWTTVTGLPWVNGPTKHIVGSTAGGFTGFGGDSHGYGSSQVNLSSLAGQTVRVGFRVEGDTEVAFYGWWIDDVRLYSCSSPVPGAPRVTRATAAATSATIAWQPPVYAGSGVRSYRIIRSDKKTLTVSYAARSASLTGVNPAVPLTVSIAAVNGANQVSAVAYARLYPTTSSVTASTARAKKNKPFTVTAKVVRRGTSTVIGAMPVVLQRKVSGATAWSNVATGTTSSRGVKAWSVRLTKSTYYRVVTRSAGTSFGSTSAARLVGKR